MRIHRLSAWCFAAFVSVVIGRAALGQDDFPPTASIFLADTSVTPHVEISWTTRAGEVIRLAKDMEYSSPNERTLLGKNVAGFVALGGTRLDRGGGHPEGLIVRCGFYKVDANRLLFEDIAPASVIRVKFRNVKFNEPAWPRQDSVIQHLKYMYEDVVACGLGSSAMDQFNTVSRTDNLGGLLLAANVRMGIFDGSSDLGTVRVRRESDGTVSLEAEFNYRLMRHLQDPWQRDAPGTFFEPQHFHFEFEVLPDRVKAEDVRPVAVSPEAPMSGGPDPKGMRESEGSPR